MKTAFAYSDTSDQELYLQTEITLNKTNLKLTAGTIASAPENPNEDAFAVAFYDEILFAGIFDGATSLKPIQSLGEQTGARFASHFLKKTFDDIHKTATPKEVLLKLNMELLDTSLQFEGATLKDTHTLPSSTATIIKIDVGKNTLSFAHVGDSFGIIYKNGTSNLFTDDKNRKFDARMFSLIAKVAKEKKITPRKARMDEAVKKALIELYIERNNNPHGTGSGVINGDPQVEQYIQTGEINLSEVTKILLGTDGLLPQGWSEHNKEDRQKLLTEIRDGGFEKLFVTKHKSEDEDPEWNFIRYKHSDDATGLLIEL